MSSEQERPSLDQVTLVAVTSVAVSATVDAIQASMRQAEFAKIILLSNERPSNLHSRIEWRSIEPIKSRADYSRFMLRDLAAHVTSSHALCIQWDGYVLNGRAWRAHFLDFDYIGAPWPHFSDGLNVGNGGFSLRSRRLLEATADLPFSGTDAEDLVISRQFRTNLEAKGMRFAPERIARQFSFERMESTGEEFGFHGAFNLVRRLPASETDRIFRSLEPSLLARSERWELFRWAVQHGRMRLASNLFQRLI